jgi:hypothetical protein
LPLAAGCIFLGIYPKPVLDVLQPPVMKAATWVQTAPARQQGAARDVVLRRGADPAPASPEAHEEGH